MVAEISILGRIVDFLSSAPSDTSIMEIKATESETLRLEKLVERQNSGAMSPEEQSELQYALIAEQMMIIAKANAFGRLKLALS